MTTLQPRHTARGVPADERGSVAIALMVILIATIMVVALLATTEAGLRATRRAGDSANALQLADAGINDATKAIGANTASFTRTASLGTAGSYTYTATKDGIVWHLDSTGTDATGVKRRVLADAVDTPLFSNAFFALVSSTLKGTADSYTSPTNTCATSPGLGVVGSNGSITFTGGVGASNCRGAFGWSHVADGCNFYGQTTIPPDASGANPIGPGRCPPAPDTYTTAQKFIPPAVTLPSGVASEGAYTCPINGTIPSGTHVYTTITLNGGCQVPSGGTSVLYATGAVTIGIDSGSCKSVVNAPIGVTVNCSNFPSGWYKSNHPAGLQINVAGNGTVSFANHAILWGVINAPNSLVSAAGGGTPQVDVFGSVLANSAASAAQFAFHYDHALRTQLTTGQYRLANWREEAVG
jgi:Tfp pilus assembly protein PilX